jgi:hypothetical protein
VRSSVAVLSPAIANCEIMLSGVFFDFSSSNFTAQDHILSTAGDALMMLISSQATISLISILSVPHGIFHSIYPQAYLPLTQKPFTTLFLEQ